MGERQKNTDQLMARHPAVNWVVGISAAAIFLTGAVLYGEFVGKKLDIPSAGLTVLFFVTTILLAAIVYFSKSYKATLLGLLGIGVTGLLIHVLTHKGLEGSALFYIGLPLLLAYVFKSSGSAKTATGGILQGISIVLLLSGPVLQEGFICIVMAAPLFYIVGGIIGFVIDYSRKKSLSKLQASPLLLLVGVMTLEGTHADLSFNRDHVVRVEQVVDASADAIEKQLNQPLVLGNDVPAFLKIFPFPTVKAHQGTALGKQTTLHFVYYKHFYFSPKIGDLTYQVTARGDNFIESEVISDESYVDTYMDWKSSKVSWQVVEDNQTKVTWEISYHRKLDPAWYFGTLEYFTTTLMAKALIKYAATPEFARS